MNKPALLFLPISKPNIGAVNNVNRIGAKGDP